MKKTRKEELKKIKRNKETKKQRNKETKKQRRKETGFLYVACISFPLSSSIYPSISLPACHFY